jgi:transketolase
MLSKKEQIRLTHISLDIRKTILTIISNAHASHIGSAYSSVELLVYLYEKVIQIDPKKPFAENRDRFILSKGWGVSALYSILSYKKIIPKNKLTTYCSDGSQFIGIATRNGIPGLEATTGSMGHGLPIAVGTAFAAKLKHQKHKIIVMIGDGELNEGSTWEAILHASHFKLDNLLLIIDLNGWQSYGRTEDVLHMQPIQKKFEAFGWSVKQIDGHDFQSIDTACSKLPFQKNKPSVIIAKTIKGKGVTLFEDDNVWHYKTPTDENLHTAFEELQRMDKTI